MYTLENFKQSNVCIDAFPWYKFAKMIPKHYRF